MIDLTTNKEDKDKFITHVVLKEESDSFIVSYASGRMEEVLFSLPSLNEFLRKMEIQFLEYKDQFLEQEFKASQKATIKKLIEALLAFLGTMISCSFPIPNVVKALIIAIAAIGSVIYQRVQSDIVEEARSNANVILTAEEFLKRKEDYKIKVIDPTSGLEKDWYLLSLSSIEEIPNARLVNKIADGITPEMREEESIATTETLKKKMNLGVKHA